MRRVRPVNKYNSTYLHKLKTFSQHGYCVSSENKIQLVLYRVINNAALYFTYV